MSQLPHFGLTGLAVMGQNLARNVARNGFPIAVADVVASNGVIHVIDKVLLPSDKDIVATAQSVPDFSILVEAVVAAGLTSTLSAGTLSATATAGRKAVISSRPPQLLATM